MKSCLISLMLVTSASTLFAQSENKMTCTVKYSPNGTLFSESGHKWTDASLAAMRKCSNWLKSQGYRENSCVMVGCEQIQESVL